MHRRPQLWRTAAALAWGIGALWCAPLAGQVERLPPIDLNSEAATTEWTAPSLGDVRPDGTVPDPLDPSAQGPVLGLPGGGPPPGESPFPFLNAKPLRSGSFQWVGVGTTWLPAFTADDFGVTEMDVKAVFGLPFFTRQTPLIIRPIVVTSLFDGPAAADLPSRVYSAYVELRTLRPIGSRFLLDLELTPGWYSDFESGDSDALRIGARATGIYSWSPTLQIVAGGTYLDRFDVVFLPVGGVLWTPEEWINFELVFPVPKLAWRVSVDGRLETWVYLAGEFGGNSWAIERQSGAADLVAYRDIRVSLGIERKISRFAMARAEIGYVFGRTIEYESPTPQVEPNDTLMVRGMLGF